MKIAQSLEEQDRNYDDVNIWFPYGREESGQWKHEYDRLSLPERRDINSATKIFSRKLTSPAFESQVSSFVPFNNHKKLD